MRVRTATQASVLENSREWMHYYNWHRQHAGIDYQCPINTLRINMNNLLALHSPAHRAEFTSGRDNSDLCYLEIASAAFSTLPSEGRILKPASANFARITPSSSSRKMPG